MEALDKKIATAPHSHSRPPADSPLRDPESMSGIVINGKCSAAQINYQILIGILTSGTWNKVGKNQESQKDDIIDYMSREETYKNATKD